MSKTHFMYIVFFMVILILVLLINCHLTDNNKNANIGIAVDTYIEKEDSILHNIHTYDSIANDIINKYKEYEAKAILLDDSSSVKLFYELIESE